MSDKIDKLDVRCCEVIQLAKDRLENGKSRFKTVLSEALHLCSHNGEVERVKMILGVK